MVISLRRLLPARSSGLPESWGGPPYPQAPVPYSPPTSLADWTGRLRPVDVSGGVGPADALLFGLAPGGV